MTTLNPSERVRRYWIDLDAPLSTAIQDMKLRDFRDLLRDFETTKTRYYTEEWRLSGCVILMSSTQPIDSDDMVDALWLVQEEISRNRKHRKRRMYADSTVGRIKFAEWLDVTLTELRARGITIQQVAERTNCSTAQISKIRRQKRRGSVELHQRIKAAIRELEAG
jgi:hypothetical protein